MSVTPTTRVAPHGPPNLTPPAAGRGRVVQLLRVVLSEVPHGRWRLVLSILLSALASGATVALMGTSSYLLSRAAQHPPILMLQVAIVGVRFFGISRGVFRYVERLTGHDLALRMQGSLRQAVYRTLSGTTLLGRRRGDLLVRVVADVDAVLDMVVRVAVPLCAGSLVIVGTTAMLSTFDLASALVLFATAVVAGVIMPLLAKQLSEPVDRAIVPARGRLGSEARELARTAADLTAYGRGDEALARFQAIDAELRSAEARAAWARGIATAGQMLANGTAVVSALWLGGLAVEQGRMTTPLLAVLVLTPLALHEVLTNFAQAAQTLTRASVSLARVAEVLDAPPVGHGDRVQTHDGDRVQTHDTDRVQTHDTDRVQTHDGTQADAPSNMPTARGLRVANLTAGWPGHPPVVTDLSFDVAPGQRVALVGPSGVGKTTVAATIMGLIPPVAGAVHASGTIGYLAQDAHIFATTLSENVRIGDKDASEDDVVTALAQARLDLPCDRIVGESGASLSGGEARRVAMARVLIGDHDVLILDEPTEHLDAETAASLMSDLWRATEGRAVLVITHDPEVTSRCDTLVTLTR